MQSMYMHVALSDVTRAVRVQYTRVRKTVVLLCAQARCERKAREEQEGQQQVKSTASTDSLARSTPASKDVSFKGASQPGKSAEDKSTEPGKSAEDAGFKGVLESKLSKPGDLEDKLEGEVKQRASQASWPPRPPCGT